MVQKKKGKRKIFAIELHLFTIYLQSFQANRKSAIIVWLRTCVCATKWKHSMSSHLCFKSELVSCSCSVPNRHHFHFLLSLHCSIVSKRMRVKKRQRNQKWKSKEVLFAHHAQFSYVNQTKYTIYAASNEVRHLIYLSLCDRWKSYFTSLVKSQMQLLITLIFRRAVCYYFAFSYYECIYSSLCTVLWALNCSKRKCMCLEAFKCIIQFMIFFFWNWFSLCLNELAIVPFLLRGSYILYQKSSEEWWCQKYLFIIEKFQTFPPKQNYFVLFCPSFDMHVNNATVSSEKGKCLKGQFHRWWFLNARINC